MDNPFVGVVQTAGLLGWCTSGQCTTCGSMFYVAIDRLAGERGDALADALCRLDPRTFVTLHDWESALQTAFRTLRQSSQQDMVLRAWLAKAGHSPSFDEVVRSLVLRWRSEGHEAIER